MKSELCRLIGLLCLALVLLVGCGNDVAPTATALPTVAPPPATSTQAAARSTLPPPTNTTAPPTNTLAAQPASAADLGLIHQALSGMAGLKSFHFSQMTAGSLVHQARDIEGDYVAPDGLYAKGQMSGTRGEFLKVGTHNYKKDAAGNWVAWTDPSEKQPQTAQETMGSFFGSAASIVAFSDLQNAGTESLNGVITQRFNGTIPLGKAPGGAQFAGLTDLPPAGTVALWIDPQTKVLHKLEIHLDTGPAMAAALAELATPGVPTAAPQAPAVLTVAMIVTRPNDPAIRVPAAPADTGTQPTPMPAEAHPATAAQIALISQALTGTAGLKSFHYTQVIAGSTFSQPWNIEGDYVAPDQEYSKGQLNGAQGEFLRIGTRSYQKDAGGHWAAWNVPGATSQTPQQLLSSFSGGLVAIAAFADFQDTGALETLDSVATEHFAGTISIGKMPGVGEQIAAMKGLPPAGTIDVWIDPQTKTLHKVQLRLDTGPAMVAAAALTAPGAPTLVPLPPYVFKVDMTVTRQNDPSISVPSPSGGAQP